jgi:uncharacterized protein YjbI with pentapeptide repeats
MSVDAIQQRIRKHNTLSLVDAPLTGVDLSGVKLADCSLLGADLSGANLAGAHLLRVDMRLANLRGACLEGATLEMVTATGAILRGARAHRVRMRHVDLYEADLSGADLGRAMLNACTFEKALLDDTDLSRAYLVHSTCIGASFRRAEMDGLAALGSSFRDAVLAGARRFFRSHEIVSELLLREAGNDFERVMQCAAIVADRARCYPEWRTYLEAHPDAKQFAFAVFDRYPESGCAEALREGWQPSSGAGPNPEPSAS